MSFEHIPRSTTDLDAIAEGKVVHLYLHLKLALNSLYTGAFTRPPDAILRQTELKALVHYLMGFDAELVVLVRKGDDLFQVSDNEDFDLPALLDDNARLGARLREAEAVGYRRGLERARDECMKFNKSFHTAMTQLDHDFSVQAENCFYMAQNFEAMLELHPDEEKSEER